MQTYTIKTAAEKMNLTPATLRYYDREGLLPFMERKESGYRMFSETDLEMLRIIECLKKTGLSIKDIRQFVIWVQKGDASLNERYQLFLDRRKAVEAQISELQKTLDLVNHKCWYYKTAIEAGTEKIHHEAREGGKLPCEQS